MFSPEVNDSFKSNKEITELIENIKEDFKTDKRAIDNNANGDNTVSTYKWQFD